jgi:hypothetical protein
MHDDVDRDGRVQEQFEVNVKRACRLALLRRSTWYRRSTARDQSVLRKRDLAHARPRFGYLCIQVVGCSVSGSGGSDGTGFPYMPGSSRHGRGA